jgi:hypothetical protein
MKHRSLYLFLHQTTVRLFTSHNISVETITHINLCVLKTSFVTLGVFMLQTCSCRERVWTAPISAELRAEPVGVGEHRHSLRPPPADNQILGFFVYYETIKRELNI